MNSLEDDVIYQFPRSLDYEYVSVVKPTGSGAWRLCASWKNSYVRDGTVIRMLHMTISSHCLITKTLIAVVHEQHHPAMSLTPPRDELWPYYKVRWDEWHRRTGYPVQAEVVDLVHSASVDYRTCLARFVPRIVQERLEYHAGRKFSRVEERR